MFRLFLALNILLLNLFACKGGYDSCKLKTIDSSSIVNQRLQIPVKNNQRLIFSRTRPNIKIIKVDPYLGLYLVSDKKKFKYPFRINNKLSLSMASVNNEMVCEGKIIRHQVGLNSFAKFSEPLFVPSLLLNSCCELEGIVTSRGIIEKEYIQRFLNIKKVSYSDVGIRVRDDKKLVVVSASNPFMNNNPFKANDIILEFDSKKVKSSSRLMRKILFSKIGSIHRVKIKRGSKILILKVVSQNRDGGGYLSDTFLEFLGLSFDESLHVTNIENKAQKYHIKTGDKLLQINGKSIKTEQEILEKLINEKESSNLLFQRGDFQFFVTVN